MSVVLGIDGGGSHTRAVLVDHTGQVVGAARVESINPRHQSPDTMSSRLAALADQTCRAHGSPVAAFLSLGGISTRADAASVESLASDVPALRAARIRVENDARAGLSGGLAGKPGMVLIAGTGSACLGIDHNGRQYWCGGWEYLADDAGSAYWIAVEAIRAAVRIDDGRLPASALHGLVFSRWGLNDPRELPERLSRTDIDRTALAQLAPDVVALAATDPIADAIIGRAVDELAGMVAVTAAHLFGHERSSLILVGGLALAGPPFTPRLVSRIEAVAPGVTVVEPLMAPVLGAAIEAARLAQWNVSPAFIDTLRQQSVSLP